MFTDDSLSENDYWKIPSNNNPNAVQSAFGYSLVYFEMWVIMWCTNTCLPYDGFGLPRLRNFMVVTVAGRLPKNGNGGSRSRTISMDLPVNSEMDLKIWLTNVTPIMHPIF